MVGHPVVLAQQETIVPLSAMPFAAYVSRQQGHAQNTLSVVRRPPRTYLPEEANARHCEQSSDRSIWHSTCPSAKRRSVDSVSTSSLSSFCRGAGPAEDRLQLVLSMMQVDRRCGRCSGFLFRGVKTKVGARLHRKPSGKSSDHLLSSVDWWVSTPFSHPEPLQST